MHQSSTLSNQFLIAMPGLNDPNFFQTVTYICEHTAEGALGIMINRPLQLTLNELMENLQLKPLHTSHDLAQQLVFAGGPVQQEQGFVVHRPQGAWDSTLKIADDMGLTTSRDILQALCDGQGPDDAFMALGYAGWGPGQLEQELAQNAWLSGPADPQIIFHTPAEQRWKAAAALLGVDLRLLTGDAGHA